MAREPNRRSATTKPSLWERFATWLGLDRSDPVDLLTVDPAKHFETWDRDLPNRYWG